MNQYIEENIDFAPLLIHCQGHGTQEGGIINFVLSRLGARAGFLVEFGQRKLGLGTLGNTARSRQLSLLNIDVEAPEDQTLQPWTHDARWILRKQQVDPLNVNDIFDEASVPANPAVIVVDIDGMDYWCLIAMLQVRRPSLLIIEYNAHFLLEECFTLAYNPSHNYEKDTSYGASLGALKRLLRTYSYTLIHIHGPLNAYFLADELLMPARLCEVADVLTALTDEQYESVIQTDLFYDCFHNGERPTWFGTSPPDVTNAKWVNLKSIGSTVERVTIGTYQIDTFAADKGGQHYKQRGHKEDSVSPLWSLIRQNLKPEVLIDVGANYGYTASLLANSLNVEEVVAIEPDPRLTDLLEQNLVRNLKSARLQVLCAAVDEDKGRVTTLGLNPTSSQDNRVSSPQNTWQNIVTPIITLNSILDNVPEGAPIFIKSDTQGYDTAVVRSGARHLKSRENWLMRLEFAPAWIESQGFDVNNELLWLTSNFSVFEAPLRTSWKTDFATVFSSEIISDDVNEFVAYVRELNHRGLGWVDLYIKPKI